MLVDLSPSLDFGTAACEKRDLAVAALAAVAHLTARRRQPDRRASSPPASSRAASRPAAAWRTPAGCSARSPQVPARAERHPRRPRRGDRAAAPPAAAPRAGRGDLRLPRRARLGAPAARAVRPPRAARRRGARPARAGAARRRHGRAGRPGDRRQREVVTTPLLCREFAAAAAAHRERVARGLRRCGAAHLRLRTDRDWIADVVRFVAHPQAGAGRAARRVSRRRVHRSPGGSLAARGGRALAVGLRRAAAPPPPRHAARSPTSSCSTRSRRSGPAGSGTSAAALLVALALLTVALAGPARPRRGCRATGPPSMLVIDVSLSMQATDVAPSRLAAAQAAAKSFADQLTPGVNLGLVSFAGTAAVLVSPTTDREPIKRAVDGLQARRVHRHRRGDLRGAAVDRDVLAGPQSAHRRRPAAGPDRADVRRQADGPGGPAARTSRAGRSPRRARPPRRRCRCRRSPSAPTTARSSWTRASRRCGRRWTTRRCADRRAVRRRSSTPRPARRSCGQVYAAARRADRLRDAQASTPAGAVARGRRWLMPLGVGIASARASGWDRSGCRDRIAAPIGSVRPSRSCW